MKISDFLYGSLFFLLFPYSLLWAQQEQPMKIGSVDLDRIMLESRAIRNLVSTVEADVKKEQDSMAEKLTRFKVLSEAYEQQKTILTTEQLKTRGQELDELKTAIEDQKDKINKLIRRSERELVGPAINLVDRAIRIVGKKEGYDLILRSDTVLFASDRCNVTTSVLEMIELLQREEDAKNVPAPSSSPAPPVPTPVPSRTPDAPGY